MQPAVTLLSLGMAALVLATGAGCGGNVEAACAFVVEYKGHRYVGGAAPVSPVKGKPLGTATQPGCRDEPDKPATEDTELHVAAIDGISPDLAITVRGRDDVVLIRDDVDLDRVPSALERLLRTPPCARGDLPVRISGRWLGIRSGDGQSELDLDPPYEVWIRVTESSFPDYARAELFLHVPPTLGRPLSRSDIVSSLQEGGTLDAIVACRDGDFVASALTAVPRG